MPSLFSVVNQRLFGYTRVIMKHPEAPGPKKLKTYHCWYYDGDEVKVASIGKFRVTVTVPEFKRMILECEDIVSITFNGDCIWDERNRAAAVIQEAWRNRRVLSPKPPTRKRVKTPNAPMKANPVRRVFMEDDVARRLVF